MIEDVGKKVYKRPYEGKYQGTDSHHANKTEHLPREENQRTRDE